jgi:hypothetical protein
MPTLYVVGSSASWCCRHAHAEEASRRSALVARVPCRACAGSYQPPAGRDLAQHMTQSEIDTTLALVLLMPCGTSCCPLPGGAHPSPEQTAAMEGGALRETLPCNGCTRLPPARAGPGGLGDPAHERLHSAAERQQGSGSLMLMSTYATDRREAHGFRLGFQAATTGPLASRDGHARSA